MLQIFCHVSRSRTLIRSRVLSSMKPKFFSQHNKYCSKKINLVRPLFYRAEDFLERVAVVDQHGSHLYSDLLHFTRILANQIANKFNAPQKDIKGSCVAILCPNDISYVIGQWATWMSGGISVPLSKSHPVSELEYFITDSQAKLVVITDEFVDIMKPLTSKLGVELLVLGKKDYLSGTTDTLEIEVEERGELEESLCTLDDAAVNRLTQLVEANKYKNRDALIVYTSGTTGRPKGVVHTHGSLQTQIQDMVTAWGWSQNDTILHALPLHHVHGIINALMTPLYCGATCFMLPKFDASKVWSLLLDPVNKSIPRSINLFMGVPTMYVKLIENYDQRLNRGRGTRQAKEYAKAACLNKIRLMVSGSAALPQPVMERWESITGHRLLERYGMTEIGMGLTNPLRGNRVPGAVGLPFPSVEVAISRPNVYSKKGYDIIAQGNSRRTQLSAGCEGEEGELLIRGMNVFKRYWQKPDATKETFTSDGWFKTGDTACYRDGVYRILGRTSVDIIKSGGYKISALDIERHLLSHPNIADVAVVGLPDMTWGQKVAAVVVLRSQEKSLSLDDLRTWAKDLLPSYQIPSVLETLPEMPRNAMGKVNKKELTRTVFEKELKKTV